VASWENLLTIVSMRRREFGAEMLDVIVHLGVRTMDNACSGRVWSEANKSRRGQSSN